MESLFSLELHVESVEDLQVLCRLPAVSFRLLDFPTLIIHHVDPTMAERLRQKVLVEAGDLSDLKDRSGNFQFQKGKSCLFKANIETLHRELQTTPLYVMLLDLWPKKPKLAASGGIEMKTAIDAIYRQVKKSGVAVPSFYKEFGDYKLFNLMGSAVSRIKLGYRLTSLGGSLIPHVPVGVQIAGKPDKQEQDVARSIADFVSEESGIDRKPAPETVDAARIEGEPEQRDMNTQTEAMVRPAKRPVTVQEERESELIITNTICPPPLYFNALSSPKTRTVIQFCSQEHENCVHGARMEESGEDYADSLHDGTAFEDVKGEDVNLAAVPVQTASVRSRHDKSPKPQQGNGLQNFLTALESSGLSRYPLLNALFQELSCMTTAAKSSEGERQMPVASKTNVSEDQEEYQRPTKTDKPHFGQQPTPKKTGQKALVSKKSSVIGLPKQRVRFKPSSLTYKTTRTQQMRLEKAQKHHTGQDRLCKTVQENRGHVAKTPEATPTRDLGRTYKKHAEFVQMTRQSSDTEAVDGAEEVKAVKIVEEGKERVESRIERNREETPPAESTPNTSCQRQNSLEIFLPMADGEYQMVYAKCTVLVLFTVDDQIFLGNIMTFKCSGWQGLKI